MTYRNETLPVGSAHISLYTLNH